MRLDKRAFESPSIYLERTLNRNSYLRRVSVQFDPRSRSYLLTYRRETEDEIRRRVLDELMNLWIEFKDLPAPDVDSPAPDRI